MPADGNEFLLNQLSLVGVAAETTPGTAVVVSAPNANTHFYDANFAITDAISGGERRPHATSLAAVDNVITGRVAQATFRTDLRNDDATFILLQACGYENNPATQCVPNSSAKSSITLSMVHWIDGVAKKIKGAAGTFAIGVPYNGIATIDWTFTGVWDSQVDATLPDFAAINSKPMLGSEVTLTLGGANIPNVGNVQVTQNNTVAPREDQTAVGGILHYYIAQRNAQISMDLESRKVADDDQHGKLLNATTAALAYTLTDGTDTMLISAPRLQRLSMTPGERGGKQIDDTLFQCSANYTGTNTDGELTFTES